MSKRIKIGNDEIAECREEFNEMLKNFKSGDGVISFKKNLGELDEKTELFFSELAWHKMHALVRESEKEVAWHGLAERTGDGYLISDIIIYPQEVTGSTVTTDQVGYQEWLASLDDDTFNKLNFQGHSHVNMGVSPSGVDTTLYDGFLSQLSDEMFYIFLIINKKDDIWIKIYDMKKNIMYERSDIGIFVKDDGLGIEGFLGQAEEMVNDKPVVKEIERTAVPTKNKVITNAYKLDDYWDDDFDYYNRRHTGYMW